MQSKREREVNLGKRGNENTYTCALMALTTCTPRKLSPLWRVMYYFLDIRHFYFFVHFSLERERKSYKQTHTHVQTCCLPHSTFISLCSSKKMPSRRRGVKILRLPLQTDTKTTHTHNYLCAMYRNYFRLLPRLPARIGRSGSRMNG